MDRTKLYDRKAYNEVHNRRKNKVVRSSLFDIQISSLSFSHDDHQLIYPQCGLASSPPNYDWTLCDLRIHDTLDTRLRLKMAEEGSGNNSKYWAYAPSLSVSKSAWTPKVVLFILFGSLLFSNNFFTVYCTVGSGCCPSQSGRLYKWRQIQWLGTVVTRYVVFVWVLLFLNQQFKPYFNPQTKSSSTLAGG